MITLVALLFLLMMISSLFCNETQPSQHQILLNGRNMGSSEYVHVVYACDQEMLAFAVISIASVVQSSLNPSRLFFHIALIDLTWTSDVLLDLRDVFHRSIGGVSSYEVKSWVELPVVLRTMKLRGSRDDLISPANYVRFYVDQIFRGNIQR